MWNCANGSSPSGTKWARLRPRSLAPPTTKPQLDKLLAEFNDLGPKLEREQAIEAATKKTEIVGSVVQSVASVLPKDARNAAIDPKTGKPFDRRTIGRIVASSDEFNHYRSQPARQVRPRSSWAACTPSTVPRRWLSTTRT